MDSGNKNTGKEFKTCVILRTYRSVQTKDFFNNRFGMLDGIAVRLL